MKRFFFSLRASYLFFGLLALVLGWGCRLADNNEYYSIFKEMTATHVWLCLEALCDHPAAIVWLVVLILLGAALFINTACCAFSQTGALAKLRNMEPENRHRTVLMALIHIAALLVIGLHAVDITIIKRQKPIRIYPDQTVQMGRYALRVSDISFVTDRAMITENAKGQKTKSFRIPAKSYSRDKNFARIEISTEKTPAETRELRILEPVRSGADYFFLDGFFIADGSQKIGVEIHHSFNPLAMIFFAVYIVLFGLMTLRYLAMRKERISTHEIH